MSLYERYGALRRIKNEIENAKVLMIKSFESGGKLLLCGNGGSCADCEHIVGELMKGFMSKRSLSKEQKELMISNADCINKDWLDQLQGGLPAIALPSASAVMVARV